jgi:hypothetical protein
MVKGSVYPFKLAFTGSSGQYKAIIQRSSRHIASYSCQLEDGGLHELSLELVPVFSWLLQDELSVSGRV